MRFKVVLSHRAERRLNELVDYLEEKWGDKAKNQFLTRLVSVISSLEEFPKIFPESDIKNEVRKCVITKQTSMYYRIRDQRIEIITIHDSRQDPNTFKL